MTRYNYFIVIRTAAIIVMVISLVMLSGCSQVTSTSAEGVAADNSSAEKTGYSSSVYSIAFFFNGNKMAALTIDDLSTLEQVTININGSPQDGPTLISALKMAGIDDFTELTAYGMSRGRLATAEATLKREQIDDSVMLDINKHGKCKLCGANIPQSNWIIDIEKIEVK
jgi:uncharacterized protein YceK